MYDSGLLLGARPTQLQLTGEYFDSRTEAQWGKYFQAVGIPYIREPEAFELPALGIYTPDFWLPDHNCYVETKYDNITEDAVMKIRALAYYSRKPGLLINRRPNNFSMFLYSPDKVFPNGNTAFWSADYRFGCESLRTNLATPEIASVLMLGSIAAHNGRYVKASTTAIQSAEERREKLRNHPTKFNNNGE